MVPGVTKIVRPHKANLCMGVRAGAHCGDISFEGGLSVEAATKDQMWL